MQSLISRDEAQTLLVEHIPNIKQVLEAGWDRWRSVCEAFPAETAQMRRITRANVVYDAMVLEAHSRFDGKPDIAVSEARGFMTLTFGHQIVLRFKKFRGSTLRTAGVNTRQRQQFERQLLVQTLPGLEVTALVAGYLLDPLEQEIHRIAIVCPLDGVNIWELELQRDTAAVVALPHQEVPAPTVEVRSTRVPRITQVEEA